MELRIEYRQTNSCCNSVGQLFSMYGGSAGYGSGGTLGSQIHLAVDWVGSNQLFGGVGRDESNDEYGPTSNSEHHNISRSLPRLWGSSDEHARSVHEGSKRRSVDPRCLKRTDSPRRFDSVRPTMSPQEITHRTQTWHSCRRRRRPKTNLTHHPLQHIEH